MSDEVEQEEESIPIVDHPDIAVEVVDLSHPDNADLQAAIDARSEALKKRKRK